MNYIAGYLEEFAKRNVVKAVRTVKYDALLCNGLCQIFRCFRFSSSSGTLRCTTEMQV